MFRNPSSGPAILVTDAGRGSAISMIRALGRRGYRMIAADSDKRSPGFRSRYADDRVLYPSPKESPQEMVDTLFEAAHDRGVDLIIPVTDEVLLPLSAHRRRFAEVCELALPTAHALETTTDKWKTVELARRLSVPVPRTHLVSTVEQAVACSAECEWPVVLKPRVSRLYRQRRGVESFTVCYARNGHQLAEQMGQFEGRCSILMQQYTPGVGCGVELLMWRGRPVAAFQHRRLREVPINGGASSLRESVALDATLCGHAVRLLRALHWTGLAMVEFKIGRDGAKLMEINGRVWGSLPLAIHSGMDFPGRLAGLWLDGSPNIPAVPQTSYKVGVRARNLELDLQWIASVLLGRRRFSFLPMPRRWAAVTALAGLFNPKCRFDIQSFDDPRPGLAEVARIAQKFVRKWKESR